LVFGEGGLVFFLGELGDLQCSVYEVVGQGLVAVDLGGPAKGSKIAVFNLPEVIFGLRIDEAEYARGVGRSINVRHAEGIALNRDGFRQGRGPDHVPGSRLIVGARGSRPCDDEAEPGQGDECERRERQRRRIHTVHSCIPCWRERGIRRIRPVANVLTISSD